VNFLYLTSTYLALTIDHWFSSETIENEVPPSMQGLVAEKRRELIGKLELQSFIIPCVW